MGDFAGQAKRDPGAKVERAAHRVHPLRMRSRQWAQVLGGKWAAILPKAELIWDLRLSLEMVSNLRPTILLRLVSRSEILICSPAPFSHCPAQQKQFCQPVYTANLGDSPCRRQTDRQTGGFALLKALCTFLCRPESLEINSWSSKHGVLAYLEVSLR